MAPTLKQRACEHIRHKLLLGDLQPGDHLSNRALARDIGISVIPLREALSQLVSEGLLEHKPGLGTFVPQTTPEDIEELYDLREALECHALEKVATVPHSHDLTDLQHAIDQMSAILGEATDGDGKPWTAQQADRWVESDIAFHMGLLRAAGNPRAVRMIAELHVMSQIFYGHRALGRIRGDPQRVLDEHRRIFETICQGDAQAARQCMVAHLRRGCRDARDAYRRRRVSRQVPKDLRLGPG